jgi:hypothetical protein
MDNISAQERIEDCVRELDKIEHMIEGMGKMSNPVPFLTKYAIIKACGTIEFCFKTIIADFHDNQTSQVKNYINSTFRTSSINPSKSNICKSLNSFDSSWNENFKKGLEALVNKAKVEQSLESLNNARNTFAHGGHPSASFDNVKDYFFDAVKMIEILDKIVTA